MTSRTNAPDTIPSPLANRTLGVREAALLLVAAAFASLMFDLPDIAVICGALAAVAWAIGMFRRPRLSWNVTMAIGAGLVVTYFWWPADHWSSTAIPLMWIGVALVAIGVAMAFMDRTRVSRKS